VVQPYVSVKRSRFMVAAFVRRGDRLMSSSWSLPPARV
jgi:hypothetical protein